MLKVWSKKILKKRRLHFPAITIVMVAVTLIVMHAISTFRNLDQHRRHWEKFLEKNARNIISMVKIEIERHHLESTLPSEDLKELMDQMVINLDIGYIGLLNKNGRWTVGSQLSQESPFPQMKGRGFDDKEAGRLFQGIKKLPDGRRVFEIGEFINTGDVQAVIVGLWMTPLEEARDQDIRHALLMGAILLILGTAAFYFIFVVQNYYLIDRTLDEMKSYTEDVVESMVNGLITVDIEGRVVSTNRMASSILGLDTREVRGEPLERVIPPGFSV